MWSYSLAAACVTIDLEPAACGGVRHGRTKGAAMTTQHSFMAGGAESHGSVVRAAFNRDLERLELDLQAMGSLARAALQRATRPDRR
jgi:hypothetical protein